MFDQLIATLSVNQELEFPHNSGMFRPNALQREVSVNMYEVTCNDVNLFELNASVRGHELVLYSGCYKEF